MTRRILFVSKGEDSASTRYRATQYFPLLAAAGYQAEHAVAAGGPLAYLRTWRQAGRADVVVVLRKTFPWPYSALLRRAARRLVFDFDDAIFCNTDGSHSPTRMSRFCRLIARCDQVWAGNRFLREHATAVADDVILVPTSVDIRPYQQKYAKPDDHFDLVWIGSRSTRKYLVEVLPALRLAAQAIPSLRLKIVADFDLPEAGVPTFAIPWSAAAEAEALGSAHVGIAPMRDDDWSRGKCALKVLQYMASGLPVLSSATGANAEIVEPGVHGYLAEKAEDWVGHLRRLAADPDLRAQMGSAGRRLVETRYALEPVFDLLLSGLKRL